MTETIYLVEWVDAFGCPAGWEFEDEAETNITIVSSIGFVIKETDDAICLAPHLSGSSRRQVAGHIAIPKVSIIKKIDISSSWHFPPESVANQQQAPARGAEHRSAQLLPRDARWHFLPDAALRPASCRFPLAAWRFFLSSVASFCSRPGSRRRPSSLPSAYLIREVTV